MEILHYKAAKTPVHNTFYIIWTAIYVDCQYGI